MKPVHWFFVHLIFGLWLMISPYALGFRAMPGAYWNSVLVGLLYTLSSVVFLYHGREELKWKAFALRAHTGAHT